MKKIFCALLVLLMISLHVLSCTRTEPSANPPETTAEPDTTEAPDATEAPDTTAEPETTVLPETTEEPETTSPPAPPEEPKDEYLHLKGSPDSAVIVEWPSSEKEFNVLAAYQGEKPQNLEYLAGKVISALRYNSNTSALLRNDKSMGTYKSEWCEVLVGNTDRNATKQVKKTLGFDEYAIKVVDNDVVITGLGYATTKAAVEKFIEIINLYADSSSGVNEYRLPSDFSYVGKVSSYENFNVDIPAYEGGVLDSVTAAENDGYIAIYKETTNDAYKRYLQKLAESGYDKYFENDLADNLYAVYKNDKTVINAYFVQYSNSVYIAVEDADKVALPPLENVYTQNGTKSSLTQMKLNNVTDSNGMCYVFQLCDGRFIVVDGGGNDTRSGKDDADNLYQLLLKLSNGKKPIVAAWFITHPHSDHYGVLLDFGGNFADKVKVERFVFNFPSDDIYEGDISKAYEKIYAAMDAFEGAVKITAHAGQKYNIANATIEMLYAPEMLAPHYISFTNDASLVFSVTMEGTKVLICGDASPNTTAMMSKMYGGYLQCDILQIAHHGSYGGSIEFYSYTNPRKLALLPVGETQEARLKNQPENVYIGKLVNIVPHFQGTKTFYMPY